MDVRSVFDLDCTPMIPGCGFECPKCVQEIESTLTRMEGVSKCYREDQGGEDRIVVEHDPDVVTVERLMEVFKGLPTFHEGGFIPSVIAS